MRDGSQTLGETPMVPPRSLAGRRAVVTGGASGIGAETVALLRSSGVRVAVLDLHSPADGDESSPESGLSLECDVADGASVARALRSVADAFDGRLDIVVNNAGIGAVGTVEDSGDDIWAKVLDVNVVGVARVTREALPMLRRSDSPAIVNVSSVVADVGVVNRAAYSASKAAVKGLTFAMAADYCAEGIRVNCICPGTVDTPWVQRLLDGADDPTRERESLRLRQPLGRLGTPGEVAQAILFLASADNAWVTGTALTIDGGMSALRVAARS